MTQVLGIGAGLVLIGFIVFAFRQGTRVKPRRGPGQSAYDSAGSDPAVADHHGHDGSSGNSGGGGGDGGH